MTSANRQAVGFIAESSWGTTPSTPTGQLLNFTSFNFGSENKTTESKTVRSDTNRQGTVRTGRDVAGDLAFELQYGAYDSLLEGVLRNTWSTPLAVTGTTISFSSVDNSINDSGAGFANAVVGQYVRVSGSTSGTNDGYMRVVSKTTSKLVVAGKTLTTQVAGPSVTVKGSVLSNGTTQKSFTFESAWADITQYISFTGVRADTFALNIATNNIVTGSIGMMGKVPTSAGSTIWSATTAAASTESYNSLDHLARIWIDDTLLTNDLTGLQFSISTNASKREAIGSLDGEGIIQNSISCSGSLTEYFQDNTLLAKNLAFTPFDLAFALVDSSNNAYVFHFPECKPKSGKPDNGGLDTQITIPHGFDATYDGTLTRTVSISRIPA